MASHHRTPRRRVAACAAALVWGLALPGAAAAPGRAAAAAVTTAMSPEARAHWQWVQGSGDNEGAPFVIIDKRNARLWLFDAAARPLGQTPVLLGLSHGDASVQGIGERPMAQIQPHERTTPAGRFIAEPGHNAGGEDIIWVDYEAAVSMHRVRATNPKERRLQRLASPTAADNRISYGCINVPASFYDRHIKPTLVTGPLAAAAASHRPAARRPVVYLLPESLPRESLFKPVKGTTPTARPSVGAASAKSPRPATTPTRRTASAAAPTKVVAKAAPHKPVPGRTARRD